MNTPLGSKPRTPEVSIVSPTKLESNRSDWFYELYGSLLASQAEWEWVVVVDGQQPPAIPGYLLDDTRIQVHILNRQVGAATARNIGLFHSNAPWITSADDDDLLPEGSLEDRLRASESRFGWVAGRLEELFEPSGELKTWDHPCPTGHVNPGDVMRAWGGVASEVPLGPTTLMIRRSILDRVGGWQALPQAEDFGMVAAVTSISEGIMLESVVYTYRKHATMMRRQPGFNSLEQVSLKAAYQRGLSILREAEDHTTDH